MIDTYDVKVLPFNDSLGYPQRQRVILNKVVYDLFYRWNQTGFATLEIERVIDKVAIWNGKLTVGWGGAIPAPVTHLPLFYIYTNSVTKTGCEIWVAW